MNYVGQLAETVFVTVKELYRGLNPATLTGGIDVIVVRQPDGSLQCSPFHVRFGKLGVLRSKEKVVDIEINGEPVELHMKLGDNGEAFFVEENEDLEERVPAHLCTSPIPMEGPESREVSESLSSGVSRRKKRRRKRVRSDSHLREEGGSSSDDRDAAETETLREEQLSSLLTRSVYYSLSEEPFEDMGNTQSRDVHPHSDGEWSLSESVFCSRPSSPKSDSELLVKPQETSGPQMQWNWGGFPKVCQNERVLVEVQRVSPVPCSQHTHFRTIQRQHSFEIDPDGGQNDSGQAVVVTVVRPEPRAGTADFLSTPRDAAPIEELTGPSHSTPTPPPQSLPPPTQNHSEPQCTKPEMLDPAELHPATFEPIERPHDPDWQANGEDQLGPAVESEGANDTEQGDRDSGIAPCEEKEGGYIGEAAAQASPVSQATESIKAMNGAEAGEASVQPDTQPGSADAATKADGQDRKRGKRSQHLGPADIYLDDLSNLDPEVAALYFPKSEAEAGSRAGAEPGTQSGNQSPQSVGSGAMDSGTEYLSDSTGDLMDVTMSLCGRVGDTSHINKEKFMEHIVSFQDFAQNPGIIEDPNLVICINSKSVFLVAVLLANPIEIREKNITVRKNCLVAE
ncbi:hypothetical protein JZ751_017588 [Albula glossodonta]|uniref:Uncharacterized protein n=1 Tax=Albula glossodonta TaxID=121402 RepID=A0A8T2PNM1_9TELE|nr:hypothetical protein JZ751_017588 [Albula glossodonta]